MNFFLKKNRNKRK